MSEELERYADKQIGYERDYDKLMKKTEVLHHKIKQLNTEEARPLQSELLLKVQEKERCFALIRNLEGVVDNLSELLKINQDIKGWTYEN